MLGRPNVNCLQNIHSYWFYASAHALKQYIVVQLVCSYKQRTQFESKMNHSSLADPPLVKQMLCCCVSPSFDYGCHLIVLLKVHARDSIFATFARTPVTFANCIVGILSCWAQL